MGLERSVVIRAIEFEAKARGARASAIGVVPGFAAPTRLPAGKAWPGGS